MKQDQATFDFTPKKRNDFREVIYGLISNSDFRSFILSNIDNPLSAKFEVKALKSEKMRMYAYLNGPLLTTVMRAMRDAGNQVDKASAILEMKVLFAKDTHVDREGNTHLIIMSQSDMSKERLLVFIKDIIHHLEEVYDTEAPDSIKYKEMIVSQDTGRIMKKL